MSPNTLDASIRNHGGKGPARRLRSAGLIPAIAYGKNFEALPLSVSPKALTKILSGERGLNTVIDLKIGGRDELVHSMVTEYQIHPVTRELLHTDFKQISLDEPVDARVALELTGRPKGVTAGGSLKQVYRTVPVRCRPADVPVKLVHDITELDVDQTFAVKDLQLPEGVVVALPADRTVAGIYANKHLKTDEDEDAKEETK